VLRAASRCHLGAEQAVIAGIATPHVEAPPVGGAIT
jgi:hypothetical protein